MESITSKGACPITIGGPNFTPRASRPAHLHLGNSVLLANLANEPGYQVDMKGTVRPETPPAPGSSLFRPMAVRKLKHVRSSYRQSAPSSATSLWLSALRDSALALRTSPTPCQRRSCSCAALIRPRTGRKFSYGHRCNFMTIDAIVPATRR
jgi:hypothetical protein